MLSARFLTDNDFVVKPDLLELVFVDRSVIHNLMISGVLVAVIGAASALYGPGDEVVELTPQNFDSKVMQSDDLWLVEFYAPW